MSDFFYYLATGRRPSVDPRDLFDVLADNSRTTENELDDEPPPELIAKLATKRAEPQGPDRGSPS